MEVRSRVETAARLRELEAEPTSNRQSGTPRATPYNYKAGRQGSLLRGRNMCERVALHNVIQWLEAKYLTAVDDCLHIPM